MIKRYRVSEIDNIWSDGNKLRVWWDIEKFVCEGWSKEGIIPQKDVYKILNANVEINEKRMLEIEEKTKHDVVAFTSMISEQLGSERKWIHFGLTSTDVVDTAQNFLIKESNIIVMDKLNELKEILKEKAIKYKKQLIMGRTHGIYGEVTSLGLKFLLWYEEIKRHISRLKLAFYDIEVSKISGSMGNYAHVNPSVDKFVADKMGLRQDKINTQVTQRDNHSFLISCFANLSSTFQKIATEVRLFQRSEVDELAEGFTDDQKGSSSMPHKKNPISSENITGLSRLIMSYQNIALENNILWHERDISHSSNERIIIPDMYNLVVYTIKRLSYVLKNLVINKKSIEQHIKDSNNIYYSQLVLSKIIQENNISREEAYNFIQNCSKKTLINKENFINVLKNEGIDRYLKKDFLDTISDDYYIRNIECIYERVIKDGL